MLRLCVLIPAFSDGGAQKQCIFLLNALQQNPNIDVTLIRFREGVHDPLLRTGRLEAVTLPCRSNYDPRIPFIIASILRRSKSGILLTWLLAADLHGFFARALAANGVRWILTERNSAYPGGLRFKSRFWLGRFANAVISNSLAGDDVWARLGKPVRRFVVPNIVKPSQAPIDPSPGNTIVCAGRLEPHKNVTKTVAAFCRLAARRPDLRFEIIGAGSLGETLRVFIDQSGQADRIKLAGFLPDLPARLPGIRALVSLSRHEGLPNVLLEAAAANVPIIASDIPEHRALLGETYPYLIGPDAEPETIAALIENVADDPNAAQALARARKAIGLMSEEIVAARYLEIFRQVAPGASG